MLLHYKPVAFILRQSTFWFRRFIKAALLIIFFQCHKSFDASARKSVPLERQMLNSACGRRNGRTMDDDDNYGK